MPVYRLDLAYDGTDFHGYAAQPGQRTIQGELEAALARHTGTVETFVAGRTDKGVHAAGQVVSFTVGESLHTEGVVRSLNSMLGPEIAVLSLRTAPEGFHARFSAKARHYRYLVGTGPSPDPFRWRTLWHLGIRLDVGAMNEAAGSFLGEQDFASLCRKAGDASTVRDVRYARWVELDGDVVAFEVGASAFCHQMVRSMVAICVDVGRAKIGAAGVPSMLSARDRAAGRGAAPPHGLTLMRVDYDG